MSGSRGPACQTGTVNSGAEPLRLGAVVLTGGTGARLGGVDKAAIEVDGVSLLERALAAVAAATEVVVVGRPAPTSRPVSWTVEDPPSGGPAAGLLAGLDRFEAPPQLVAVLAVDMPRAHAGTVARLTWAVEGDPGVDGAVLLDADGRRQTLAAVYRLAALSRVRAGVSEANGLSMRKLVGGLCLAEVPAVGDEARDVDTWTDLRDLRG
jgi:molybdopterin-guanine dinucleotide biosynthesis protein A